MTDKLEAPLVAAGLDFALTEVGRACVHAKARVVADSLLAQYCYRRRNPGMTVYQRLNAVGDRGLPGASIADAHTWIWHTGPNTRAVVVSVLSMGAGTSTKVYNAQLQVTTSAPAVTTLMPIVWEEAGPTFPDAIALQQVQVAVTPDVIEILRLEEVVNAASEVYILAASVQELPISRLDVSVDVLGGDFTALDPTVLVPGQNIIDFQYDNVLVAVEKLRCTHKKTLIHVGNEHSCMTHASEDIVSKSQVQFVQWDYYPSPWLPETAGDPVSVTLEIVAKAVGTAHGSFAVVPVTGAVIGIVGIGALGVYSTTGLIPRAGDSASLQLCCADEGTTSVTLYSVNLFENNENRLLFFAPLDETGLPTWATFTRAAGNNSYDTAAPAFGSTFVAMNAGVNVPRFHYVAAAGRRMLLVEPARTNILKDANFVDANHNDIPDNWANFDGTPGTHYDVIEGSAPHGGDYFRWLLSAGVGHSTGIQHAGLTIAALTQYVWSARYCGNAWLAGEIFIVYDTAGAGWATMDPDNGTYNWLRQYMRATTVGASVTLYQVTWDDWASGAIYMSLPQLEAGEWGTTWIPTGAGATETRAAELCALSGTIVNLNHGKIGFKFSPDFASTEPTGQLTLFAMSATDRIVYDGADDKFKVINNGLAQATSAAQVWAAGVLRTISMEYGEFGTILTINGTAYSDTTPWVAPGAAAVYLGSDAGSANCAGGAYADLETWG